MKDCGFLRLIRVFWCKNQQNIRGYLHEKSYFGTNTPLPSVLYDTAMRLYRQYLITGGMPEYVR